MCEVCEMLSLPLEQEYIRWERLKSSKEIALLLNDIHSAAKIMVQMRECEEQKRFLRGLRDEHTAAAHPEYAMGVANA